jgi:hypothetical protein
MGLGQASAGQRAGAAVAQQETSAGHGARAEAGAQREALAGRVGHQQWDPVVLGQQTAAWQGQELRESWGLRQVASGPGQQTLVAEQAWQMAETEPSGQSGQAAAQGAWRRGPRAKEAAGRQGWWAASVGHRAEAGPGGRRELAGQQRQAAGNLAVGHRAQQVVAAAETAAGQRIWAMGAAAGHRWRQQAVPVGQRASAAQ